MSTSFIYHCLGLVGYRYVKAEYKDSKMIITVHKNPYKVCCPDCESTNFIRRGKITRTFKTLPLGKKPILIKVDIQRIQCLDCGCLKQEKLNFADPKKTYTRAFERYVLSLVKLMTIQDVAIHLGISWNTVKEIHKKFLQKHFSKPNLKKLTIIAIDEISIGKGHNYLTIVLDLKTGAVVFIGDGKKADSLIPFWKRLKRAGAKIDAVAIDMAPAYIDAVTTNLPNTTIVFDHFHIIKYFNDKLSELRRKIYAETDNLFHQKLLKGTRWLLLKNPENLRETKNEKQHLQQALQINQPLAAAYYLKEDLRLLWTQKNKDKAEKHLSNWIRKALASGVLMLKKLAKTLAAHRSGILAYYDFKISTAPLEGTNNKIKTMKRQAYGYRDKQFLKLKIFALHKTKYALIG
jgi:transposase